MAFSLLVACQATPPSATVQVQRIPIVGWFEGYNEILRGSVRFAPIAMRGAIELAGGVTGIRCVGLSDVQRVGLDADFDKCPQGEGVFSLNCTDGRTVQGLYATASCLRGSARGVDQWGNRMQFVYGVEEEELPELTKRVLASQESKPALPRYDPARVRSARGFSTGTAFFVTSEGHLITNFHVIANARRLEVVSSGGAKHEGVLLRADTQNDLALLRIESDATPLPIAQAALLAKGTEVFTVGYPLVSIQGQEAKATFGRVNALSGVNGDPTFAQIDVPIQPGNSGGPLLDRQGRVVGVVTSTLNQLAALRLSGALPQNVNYAIKSEPLLALLRRELGADWAGLAVSDRVHSIEEVIARSESSVVLIVSR